MMSNDSENMFIFIGIIGEKATRCLFLEDPVEIAKKLFQGINIIRTNYT
jgi:hypothetical protein